MENDEQIDFLKLEREFSRAVEADEKYRRENAAKFRAVEQRVGSYEEFKDIVAASHLKPLDKKDKLGQEKLKQPWNSLSSKQGKYKNSEKHAPNLSTGKEKQCKNPQTSHTFTKTWKHELKTTQDKYGYLCQTGGHCLGQICKTEIPMGLFGEIVAVLSEGFQPNDYDNVCNILSNLATTKRFNLIVDFLSNKEKRFLEDLFRKLHEDITDRSQDKESGLKELIIVYKVNL